MVGRRFSRNCPIRGTYRSPQDWVRVRFIPETVQVSGGYMSREGLVQSWVQVMRGLRMLAGAFHKEVRVRVGAFMSPKGPG